MKKFKIFKQILLSALMISFAACSSDDDSPETPEEPGEVVAKVKEFKMREVENNSTSDWSETSTIYDYDNDDRISKVVFKYVYSVSSNNYEQRYNINYNNEGKVQNIAYEDTDTGESGTINFNYSGGQISSISSPEGSIDITYHSGNNSFTYQLDPELDVDTIYFNGANDITRHASSAYGTSQLTPNSNTGVYTNTSLNKELKIYLAMRAGGMANNDYYQTKEMTKMVISGQTLFGPIDEPYVLNVVNVVRNADGLIESYSYSEDFQEDYSFEITYTD